MIISSTYARTVSLLVIALGMSGCSALHTYNNARDEQAKAVRTAWGKVDVDGLLATDRDNLAKILESKLEMNAQVFAAYRDYRLSAILGQSSIQEGLLTSEVGELAELILPGGATKGDKDGPCPNKRSLVDKAKCLVSMMDTATSKDADAISNKQALQHPLGTFYAKGLSAPSCADLESEKEPKNIKEYISSHPKPNEGGAVKQAMDDLKVACKNVMQSPYLSLGGGVKEAVDLNVQDEQAVKSAQIVSEVLRTRYSDALAAYNEALENTSQVPFVPSSTLEDPNITAAVEGAAAAAASPAADGKSPCGAPLEKTQSVQERVFNTAVTLCKATRALEGASDAFSIQLLSKDKIDALDKFISAVTKTKPGDPVPVGMDKGAAAFILVPKLVDDAKKELAAAKMPMMAPFKLKRDLEKVKLDAAAKEIGLLKSKVAYSQNLVEAEYARASQLYKALKRLLEAPSVLAMRPADAFSFKDEKARMSLFTSATLYLDAIGRLQVNSASARDRRIDTIHQVAVVHSEESLNQWRTLIGTSIDQVAVSASLGLQPSMFDDIIKNILLLGIAVGANK
ncbi:hypothetical protein [Undibacterium sp.]|uniref:hypothetical protein n=1 Tax=Undibacterium sp. TaxID=1914977 RepID=UPI0025DEFC96|nr:hypothetical protein [Undibacterium sp.]